MLRHQSVLAVSDAALKAAPSWAQWPARLQLLDKGPLTDRLPGRAFILDGGHNADAGQALALTLREEAQAKDGVDLITGMLANKDISGFLTPLRPLIRSIRSLPVPGHEHHGAEAFAAIAADWGIPHRALETVTQAVDDIAADASSPAGRTVLMAGTLYLAGQVLVLNDQLPV
jgi:dihydrofolate synthase / folylpolyglutamate synthase